MHYTTNLVGIVPARIQVEPKILPHEKVHFSISVSMGDAVCGFNSITNQSNARSATLFLKVVKIVNVKYEACSIRYPSDSLSTSPFLARIF